MKKLAFLASRKKGTNYGGVEMMTKLEAWVAYIGKRRAVRVSGRGQKKM